MHHNQDYKQAMAATLPAEDSTITEENDKQVVV